MIFTTDEIKPKSVRKFADSLSAGALAVSSYAFMTDYKVVAYIVLATAFVGKFVSNLFADEPKSNSL